jgi:hypothetical protein
MIRAMIFKRKQKKPPLTLDFVTDLSPEECDARLREIDAKLDYSEESETYHVTRGGQLPGSRKSVRQRYFEVSCSVSARAVQDGTHVLGQYAPRTARRIAFEDLMVRIALIAFFAGGLIFALCWLAVSIIPDSVRFFDVIGMMAGVAVFLAGVAVFFSLPVGIYFSFISSWIEEEAQQLLHDIRAELDTSPSAREPRPDWRRIT